LTDLSIVAGAETGRGASWPDPRVLEPSGSV